MLLGEADKFAAVSTYRFRDVNVTSSGGLLVSVNGVPGEKITLLWAALDLGPKATKDGRDAVVSVSECRMTSYEFGSGSNAGVIRLDPK